MAHSVNATLIIRNDSAAAWKSINPILKQGEIGAENDTGLLKLGDGLTKYNDLDYINNNVNIDGVLITYNDDNKLTVANFGKEYYVYDANTGADKKITVSDTEPWPDEVELDVIKGVARWVKPAATYNKTQGVLTGLTSIELAQGYSPYLSTQVTTKQYVDDTIASQIANSNHLTRSIVTALPTGAAGDEIEPNVIYMVKDTTATGDDKYKEYMLINGVLEQVGDTSPDLNNYVEKPTTYTEGNLLTIGSDGALIDTGIAATDVNVLSIATETTLGGVLSSTLNDHVAVLASGRMEVNNITTDKIINGLEEFVLNGGTA